MIHAGTQPHDLSVQYVVDREGKPVSVILSVADFEELLEEVADAYDVRMLKAVAPDDDDAVPLAAFLAELDGTAPVRPLR